jgi:hypothetical protein
MQSKLLGIDRDGIAYYGNSKKYIAININFNVVVEHGRTEDIGEKIASLGAPIALPIETIELAINALSATQESSNFIGICSFIHCTSGRESGSKESP